MKHDGCQRHFDREVFTVGFAVLPFELMEPPLGGYLHHFIGLLEGASPIRLRGWGQFRGVSLRHLIPVGVSEHSRSGFVAVYKLLAVDQMNGIGG